MQPHDLPRLWDWLTGLALDAALFSDPDSVCYITGYASQTDASFPFKGCPTLVLVIRGQTPAVVVPCTEESDFRQASWLPDISSYVNYDWQQPVDIVAAAQQAVVQMLQGHGVNHGTVGVEALHLPARAYTVLSDRLATIHWRDITGRLASLRAIKTPEELEAIQRTARICDVGQARVRALIEPGKSEIAIFAEARACLEEAAGQRIHIAGDLVTGQRSGRDGGGLPRADCLERGDLVISDIVPRVNGWWADSCATIAVGEPSAAQERIYQIVADAFQRGVDAAKPGIKASQLDAIVRGYVERHGYQYPHHTGHGVGVAQAEAPWIVPYNDEVLQEGMVIALEPGIYPGGAGGVRIEDLFLVTRDQLKPLTHHDKRL